jgi:hypothetical protein
MTPRQDLLDHAVDLFPAPEGSVAKVERDVARRHRNRRLGAAAVVIAIWVAIGVAVTASRPDDAVPIHSPTPAPSPTVAPGSLDAQGWPSYDTNPKGLYSWDPRGDCGGGSCDGAWIQNGTDGGSGRISIHFDGVAGITQPHEATSLTIFGYKGSYQAGLRGDIFLGVGNGSLPGGGYKASCEQWMADIQGTTVTITLCVGLGAPAHESAEAHEIIDSINIESRDADAGFRLVFVLPTKNWSGQPASGPLTATSTSVTSAPSTGVMTETPSPTVAPGTIDAQPWPTTSRNQEGVYSWDGGFHSDSRLEGFMHNAYAPGSGDMSIVVDGIAGHIEPHEGTPAIIFGYEGSYLRFTGDPTTGGPRASCEQWMVDIQGTTVTIKLCAKPGAPADEIVEAHEIVESMRVESPYTSDLGFRLVFTLTTNTWDSG